MSFEALHKQLSPFYEQIAKELLPAGKLNGREFEVADSNGDRRGKSLKVNIQSGVWRDFADGNTGGDIISLWAHCRGINNGLAARQLQALYLHINEEKHLWEPAPGSEVCLPGMIRHWKYGEPACMWWYPGHGGTCRFDLPGGKKEVLPYSWCRCVETGEVGFRWKSFRKPRPLYSLECLREHGPVLIVEGEKCVDAAKIALSNTDWSVITWPGGSKSIKYADWSALEGRQLTIWPDADHPGLDAAHWLVEHFGACRVVQPPKGVQDGWDIADAIGEHIDIRELLERAPVVEPKTPEEKLEDKRPAWTRQIVYIGSSGHYYDLKRRVEMKKDAFNNFYTSKIPAGNADDRPFASVWCAKTGMITNVDTLAYLPWEPHGVLYDTLTRHVVLNTCSIESPKACEHYSEAGEAYIDLLSAHILWLCNGDPADAQILVDFLRHNAQHPGRKIRWAPLISSKPGAGKKFLHDLLKTALGYHNVTMAHANVVMSQFNSYATGSAVCFLEEMKITGHNRHDAANAMKALISDDQIVIHEKHQPSYVARNTTNYVAFSNYLNAIPIDETDRRWWPIRIDSNDIVSDIEAMSGLNHGDYFDRIFQGLQDHQGAVMKWLLEPVSQGFYELKRAPHSRFKEAIVSEEDETLTGLAEAREVIEDGAGWVNELFISSAHFWQEIEAIRTADHLSVHGHTDKLFPLSNTDKKLIRQRLGLMLHSYRPRVEGRRLRIYVVNNSVSQRRIDERIAQIERGVE